jgi:flagellar motor protein MotB
MSQTDVRQEKSYRRGLILGLTIAEIMILLIFVLLMALSAALSQRDRTIEVLGRGGAIELFEILSEAYPQSTRPDDFFKELVRAIEVRKAVEAQGLKAGAEQWQKDAELGAGVRAAAARARMDPFRFLESLASSRKDKRGKWPPFFNLSEAGGNYFDSGKATLRPEFRENLELKVVPRLVETIRDYDIDVIEVIGHTDEVPMIGQSNLDAQLILASTGRIDIGQLQSTDNAGLAIARAVAVVQILRADQRLKGIAILPLSAAQMIVPIDKVADGTAAESNQSRRRIEIRLRRSTQEDDANAASVLK